MSIKGGFLNLIWIFCNLGVSMLANGCQPGKKIAYKFLADIIFCSCHKHWEDFESLHSSEVCSTFSVFSIMIFTYEIVWKRWQQFNIKLFPTVVKNLGISAPILPYKKRFLSYNSCTFFFYCNFLHPKDHPCGNVHVVLPLRGCNWRWRFASWLSPLVSRDWREVCKRNRFVKLSLVKANLREWVGWSVAVCLRIHQIRNTLSHRVKQRAGRGEIASTLAMGYLRLGISFSEK